MSKLISNINETLEVIRKHTSEKYPIGIILGTGLGGLVKEINIKHQIDYENLPHFPISTVESHHGKLIFGTINGKNVVVMQGRFHFYEGYTMQQITYPVRVMKFLGVETLLVSNACGGMNPQYRKGDVMIMVDHINMLGDNPLIGKNEDELGPRFPDMSLKHRRHLRLMIVGGDGIHTSEGKKQLVLARTYGVEESIAFIGRIEQKDLPPYYNVADVMVMPSHYESFGLVSLEALACVIPVVATPVGVMDTLIKEGQNGRLVANGDAKLLAKAIDKVTSLLPALSADALRQTVQMFGWPNIASAIVKEYGETLSLESRS